jgi:hypothetical protein
LRHSLNEVRLAWHSLLLEQRAHKYNPNQPRIPAGNFGAGRWTDSGGAIGVRLAAADKPSLGRSIGQALALDLARGLIEAYRSANSLWDLFGNRDGAVTVTSLNGTNIFGSNSTSPTYNSVDDAEANRMRARYLELNPDSVDENNIGRMPNNAFYHAETTVLLRAARANGGTLAGKTLRVFGDTPMCNNCPSILPFVGLELGNPTVTFVNPGGRRRTMRDGVWRTE